MIPLVAINQLAAVYRGRGKDEAYLEFAQEHFLDWLRTEHLFEDEAVVFKGGSAIRKFVLGTDGRFSTDLDFAVPDPTYADHWRRSYALDQVNMHLSRRSPARAAILSGQWTRTSGRTLPGSSRSSPAGCPSPAGPG